MAGNQPLPHPSGPTRRPQRLVSEGVVISGLPCVCAYQLLKPKL